MLRPFSLPSRLLSAACLMAAIVVSPAAASAQAPAAPQTPAAPPTPAAPTRHEAEQNLVNLPTTQPMRRFSSHFRITHRFARDLRRGSFGELASDLFSLDSGAIIGLDYRFAPSDAIQLGIYRSMLFRTIQASARYDIWQQAERPVSLSFVGSFEGTNNMRDEYARGLGAVASRSFGPALALYASPMFVWNSRAPGGDAHEDHEHEHDVPEMPVNPDADDHRNTAFIGLGARLRVLPRAFVVLEFTPRIAGHSPGRGAWGVALERHTAGHIFQINLTNTFGTTYGQTARGGEASNVYLGFNLARRF
jgi:hypothetical protein